jgi:hypothetical protein
MNDKTLPELRKACKSIGIVIRKQTFSHGPHLTFRFAENDLEILKTRCYGGKYAEYIKNHQEQIQQLKEICKQFHGMKIDGQHVYGLKK